MIERKENWQQCLNKAVEAARERPFSWGQHDCCVFSANCVEVMTGKDFMADIRGKYKSQESAKEVLNELGSKTLYRTLQRFFGQAIHPALAHRGDVVYRRDGGFPAVGICLGDTSVFVGVNEMPDGTAHSEGLVTVKTLSCIKAFRV